MYENPSAGKFEAPPQPKPPGIDRSGAGWLLIVLMIATSYPVTHWLFPRRGWLGLLASVVALALAVLQHFLLRAQAAEAGRDNPYSPPTSVTR